MPKKKPRAVGVRDVGARFRVARKAAELTAKAMAADAGLDEPQISKFETGQKGLNAPNLLRLLAAAHDHGINLDYVVAGAGNPLRSVVLVADDAKVLDDLRSLVSRLGRTLKKNDERPRQLPRPASDRK